MKTNIQVDYNVNEEKFEKIKKFVEHENLRNSNLCEFDLEVERGEYTCIDSKNGDDYNLISLLRSVINIINEN